MSEIKVNKISPRTNCGTVTLGDSGDTFTIPSGATINNQGTATNFGATGSASWTTTVKTNSDSGFTAVAGEGYFLNTTAGTISVNLPAGSAGAVVAFKDYAGTFDTNAVTLVQNGSDKIGGSTENATLETEGIAVTLVFIDSTQGWLVTDSGLQDEAPTPQYIAATGGTVTTVCTNFKVHAFTGPGTFCVSAGGNSAGSNTVDYLVVAGGGGGGNGRSGAGGAGGLRIGAVTASPCHSPLVAPGGLPVSVQGYSIVVGAGGSTPGSGAVSTFSTITSAGGGGGGCGGSNACGVAGGSGGGNGVDSGGPARTSGAAGNTPPVSPPQGNPGGGTIPAAGGEGGGGGGGATAAGSPQPADRTGGPGGAGLTVTPVFGASPQPFYQADVSNNGASVGGQFAGGGGGGGTPTGGHASSGGSGGGSGGSYGTNAINNATANTGGGGLVDRDWETS
jgi:hypothetical protein